MRKEKSTPEIQKFSIHVNNFAGARKKIPGKLPSHHTYDIWGGQSCTS